MFGGFPNKELKDKPTTAKFLFAPLPMKRFLSFLWPMTRVTPSKVNGPLEVTWINGKKVLDSKNANYSYGNLQRILEVGLSKINLKRVDRVLLLGLGGGSIIRSLLKKYHFKGSITAVEIDEVVIELAAKEFQVRDSEQIRIVEGDALDYVLRMKEPFPLVIVDVFIDDTVPEPFYSKEFCDGLRRCISQNGFVLFNLGINTVRHEGSEEVVRYFREHPYFSCQIMENVQGYNRLLLAERIDSDQQPFKLEELPKI